MIHLIPLFLDLGNKGGINFGLVLAIKIDNYYFFKNYNKMQCQSNIKTLIKIDLRINIC